MKRFFALLILLFATQTFAQKHAMTIEDMWKMQRIGSTSLSPKGDFIAFSVTSYNMDENNGNTDIWIVKLEENQVKSILNSEKNESSPVFHPDGKRIFFQQTGQVFSCDYDGKNIKQITDFYCGVSGIKFNKDGSEFLFVAEVYPNCTTQDCNQKKDEEIENSKEEVKVIENLLFRHWDSWRGEKRSHLFVYNLNTNSATDLTHNCKSDIPTIALGSANDYNFSSDGKSVVFTMNPDEVQATSTNNEIFRINVDENGKDNFELISTSKGNDNQPIFSPNGKMLAFTSMKRAGFEADKQDLIIYDVETKSYKNLTENFAFSISEFIWSHTSKKIYFVSSNEIHESIYQIDATNGKVDLLEKENVNSDLILSANGNSLYFKKQKSNLPSELFSINITTKKVFPITSINQKILDEIEFGKLETFWVKGANGDNVQSILIKPPFLDENKKYPLIFLIHGGPQGHWSDDFHYRWNIQLFASRGYVVIATNPRGSTGYGQKFVDEISGDWGGKPYEDLMNSLDFALDKYLFIDKNNLFAAGASYGGFMINWIEGKNTRFNALVSHDGVFDQESMYGTTEELWFPEWEMNGTPWENPEFYSKWSPSTYVKNFKTPMLVVQGGNDFRVPEGQAFQLFTSLQKMGVESKLLYFPKETHFVTKPQNARFWWNSIFDWYENHKR